MKLDINKKLVRFVPITRAGKKDWYQIKYETPPTFCGNCGLLGQWYQECGTGEDDASKLEWGDFILADEWRSRGFERGAGRGNGRGRGGPAFGRGFRRGINPPGSHDDDFQKGLSRSAQESWRWNGSLATVRDTEILDDNSMGITKDAIMSDGVHSSRKILAADSNAFGQEKEQGADSMVLYENHAFVASTSDPSEATQNEDVDPMSTPQKNLNKKKHKGVEGEGFPLLSKSDFVSGSAAPGEGDRREQ